MAITYRTAFIILSAGVCSENSKVPRGHLAMYSQFKSTRQTRGMTASMEVCNQLNRSAIQTLKPSCRTRANSYNKRLNVGGIPRTAHFQPNCLCLNEEPSWGSAHDQASHGANENAQNGGSDGVV
jgi:hypothetical protein